MLTGQGDGSDVSPHPCCSSSRACRALEGVDGQQLEGTAVVPGVRAPPHYLLGGLAMGRPASGVGMTFSPVERMAWGVVSPAPEASTDR